MQTSTADCIQVKHKFAGAAGSLWTLRVLSGRIRSVTPDYWAVSSLRAESTVLHTINSPSYYNTLSHHTHACAHIHTHTHTHSGTHIHTHTHFPNPTHTHAHIQSGLHTHVPPPTYNHAYTHVRASARACAHTHAHTDANLAGTDAMFSDMLDNTVLWQERSL